MAYYGELAALLTALLWAFSAIAIEFAGKNVGSISVNLIRLVLGFIFLTLFMLIKGNNFLPIDANQRQWLWLSLSGIIGLAIGDFLLIKAFIIIGSRISMLIMTLVPPLSAIFGWLILNEKISMLNLIGMIITLVGISIVILKKNTNEITLSKNISKKGLLLAIGATIGQSIGLVFSKLGIADYNALSATQIRLIAGIIGFLIITIIFKRFKNIIKPFYDKKTILAIIIGSLFGPFLGITFSLVAIQNTKTGIASTLMSIVPIIIIPLSMIIFKHKVSLWEFAGTIVSVLGVMIFFI
ncbi:MAG TPA: DMT family transporter [Bacteroidales bacterium]|nr:DMT family transporter [Bacteroidales bacterium]